jgi:hypothetical protein
MKNNIRRTGNKWNVNELLSLQREYELLEMDIHDIAARHQRTPWAIIFKLKAEGFISHLKEAKGSKNLLLNLYEKKDDVVSSSDSDSDSDYEEEDSDDSDYEDEDDDPVSSSSDSDYEDDISVSSSSDTEDDKDQEDDDDEKNLEVDNKINNITKRVWDLETTVKGISAIVKLLFASFLSKPTNNSLSVNA